MIDLHLHLDGSLSVDTVYALAKKQGISLPFEKPEQLKAALTAGVKTTSLNEYLRCFELPLKLLQTQSSVEYAVYELVRELAAQGIIYSEIRFAPQLHTKNGCTQNEIIKAAIRGVKRGESDFKTKTNLILCAMRGGSKDANMQTVRLAAEFLGGKVCAVDLAGAEALYSTGDYQKLFELAAKLNLPFTIHAGEAAGADSVRAAVDFGASRIGHAVAAVEDEQLLREIKARDISIECCLTSNLQTGAVRNIANHPIKRFLQLGINATINTDNMTVSDTNIKRELEMFKSIMPEFSNEKLMMNSISSAFLKEEEKQSLLTKVKKSGSPF